MKAKIVTVFNQKGGAGKSTLTYQLAGTSARRGLTVGVVDMDPQGTVSAWASSSSEDRIFPVAVMSLAAMEGKMHREVSKYVDKFDLIIIDCPPAINDVAVSAMLVSDLALIPLKPAPADMRSAVKAKQLVEGAWQHNPTLKVRVVPSMVQPTALAKDLLSVMAEDDEFPLTVSRLGFRNAFQECQILGTTVHDVPRAKTAIEEVEALTTEVFQVLGIKANKKGARK